jgi:hypothetical protein
VELPQERLWRIAVTKEAGPSTPVKYAPLERNQCRPAQYDRINWKGMSIGQNKQKNERPTLMSAVQWKRCLVAVRVVLDLVCV